MLYFCSHKEMPLVLDLCYKSGLKESTRTTKSKSKPGPIRSKIFIRYPRSFLLLVLVKLQRKLRVVFSGSERISGDIGFMGCEFGSDFCPRVRKFGYPQHYGFGADSTFHPRMPIIGAPKNWAQQIHMRNPNYITLKSPPPPASSIQLQQSAPRALRHRWFHHNWWMMNCPPLFVWRTMNIDLCCFPLVLNL